MTKDAEIIAGEAYQVIGLLASEAGLFNHPEVVRALEYFSAGWQQDDTEILPFAVESLVTNLSADKAHEQP